MKRDPSKSKRFLLIYDDPLPDLCLFCNSYGADLELVLAGIVNDWLIVQVQPKE